MIEHVLSLCRPTQQTLIRRHTQTKTLMKYKTTSIVDIYYPVRYFGVCLPLTYMSEARRLNDFKYIYLAWIKWCTMKKQIYMNLFRTTYKWRQRSLNGLLQIKKTRLEEISHIANSWVNTTGIALLGYGKGESEEQSLVGYITSIQIYMRMLPMTIRGAPNYEDIRCYDNVLYNTFREACQVCGLLEDDNEWFALFDEAIESSTPF